MTTVKATLVILRHGETVYNKNRLMTGRHDLPLTPLGEEQARQAGKLIKDIPFAKVYASPLSRAFNTAALAVKAAGQNVPVEKREAIIEADAGSFSGRHLDNDPVVVNFKRTYGTPMPGGGESDKDVAARAQKFFDEEVLPRLAKGENVLLVAHSGTMHAFDVVLGVQKAPADNEHLATQRIPNASPMVYEYENGALKKHYVVANPAANQNLPPLNKNKYGPKP